MAKMGVGYGSEFHLLRLMGRHRKDLDKVIKSSIGLNGDIDWYDFFYSSKKSEYDKEYIGIEFLEGESYYKDILQVWRKFWPNSSKSMNWDAIGRIGDCWLHFEAKAHAGELKSDSKAREKSRLLIQKQFTTLGVEKNIDTTGWLNNFYQKANRLLFLDFLQKQGINAKMVFLYFINGYEVDPKKNIGSVEEWQKSIKEQDEHLDIVNNDWVKHNVHNVFIDVRGAVINQNNL